MESKKRRKAIIVYVGRNANLRFCAETLAQAPGTDLVRISDETEGRLPDLAPYATVFLGVPPLWRYMPRRLGALLDRLQGTDAPPAVFSVRGFLPEGRPRLRFVKTRSERWKTIGIGVFRNPLVSNEAEAGEALRVWAKSAGKPAGNGR